MELYWTTAATVLAGLWALLAVMRDQQRRALEDTRKFGDRLFELERLRLEHPELGIYLSGTALENKTYFRDTKRLEETQFFKAKAFIYAQLDLFDEILAACAHSRAWIPLTGNKVLIENADWETYMKHWMTHPLSCSILEHEGHIFGRSLQAFWHANKQEITTMQPDRFSW